MPIISKSKRWLWILPYLFLAPWLIGLLVFNAIPILSSLYLSFTNYNFVSSPNWIGLKNYVTMFGKDPQYLQALKVTVTYVLVAVPLELAFALFLALVLNKGIRALGFLPGGLLCAFVDRGKCSDCHSVAAGVRGARYRQPSVEFDRNRYAKLGRHARLCHLVDYFSQGVAVWFPDGYLSGWAQANSARLL